MVLLKTHDKGSTTFWSADDNYAICAVFSFLNLALAIAGMKEVVDINSKNRPNLLNRLKKSLKSTLHQISKCPEIIICLTAWFIIETTEKSMTINIHNSLF